jgi:hypothetical protein
VDQLHPNEAALAVRETCRSIIMLPRKNVNLEDGLWVLNPSNRSSALQVFYGNAREVVLPLARRISSIAKLQFPSLTNTWTMRAITSGIGGERYPISIRYAPDFRDDIQKLARG